MCIPVRWLGARVEVPSIGRGGRQRRRAVGDVVDWHRLYLSIGDNCCRTVGGFLVELLILVARRRERVQHVQ